MSVAYRMQDQVLRVDDRSDAVEEAVHKFDAFLNLLCAAPYAFQRDAVRDVWRFLVSEKYPDTERLIRENWNARPEIAHRFDGGVDAYLQRVPLRAKKSATLDLATGTGKSYALYALAAMALAEGMADRVLVLCPSRTIEEGLLDKFGRLIGTHELSAIMRELGARVAVPGLKRGNETVGAGDICVENIHAVYENAGSSIADSFRGRGGRTLVLNDEAHHLFSPDDTERAAVKKWLQFLLNPEFDFRYVVNATGTPFIGNEYFRDVVHRYGLKQAIEDGIVKKPDYVIEETKRAHGWDRTRALHEKNRREYAGLLKPITIVVTADIAGCVEAWDELARALTTDEGRSREEAERRCIWVASGVPSGKAARERVERLVAQPEKRRLENLAALRTVDDAGSPVEWIVSVSMLTEGWDVKNVFQIVPHESRAFESKLLIAQVLGRGLRVPAGLPRQPLVTVNNHAAWSDEIRELLADVLEIENRLSWGFLPGRERYVFPLHNLRYEPEQRTVGGPRARAREPEIAFAPQSRRTRERTVFAETGALMTEVEHRDNYDLDQAVRILKVFLNDKDPAISSRWPKRRIREKVVAKLREAGQPDDFLSRENLLRLQQGFGPMFRDPGAEYPRAGMAAGEVIPVDLTQAPRSSISESMVREHAAVYFTSDSAAGFSGTEQALWGQYLKHLEAAKFAPESVSDHVKALAARLAAVEPERFKTPWNLHVASHEPERRFTDLLLAEADLFDAFVKMPDRGGYSFPYSYKPAGRGRTHVQNEQFNPDFFLKLQGKPVILVVEIKDDGDDRNRNRAKYRDGRRHFEILNERLAAAGDPTRYHFKFLSPDDCTDFFAAARDGRYANWASGLMIELSRIVA